MKKLLPLYLIIGFTFIYNHAISQAAVPFTTCPDVNIAVARAGLNADIQNPYYIYNVNTANGSLSVLPGGPLINPASPPQTLQVNGVGINKVDGYMYGLAYNGSVNTATFVRFDKNYGVTILGNIAPPTSPTGVFSFLNSAAGDIDRSNNYYFTGFTGNVGGPNGTILDKIFLGKISNISTLNSTPTAQYFEVDYSDLPCSNYITTLTTDPNNSGLKDFVYNPVTTTFLTYITYKPTGAANFSGQMVEVKQVPGSSPLKYKMFCSPVVNTHTSEVSGTLIDNAGNFEILFTDGTMSKLNSSGSAFHYDGTISVLNAATGLPNPLRGDLASCGGAAAGPLPVRLTSFDATQQNCKTVLSWVAATELNLSRYELEQSFDGVSFSTVSTIPLNRNKIYATTLMSPGMQAYYRVKAIDLDGNSTYSTIINVADGCKNLQSGFVINPNPVKNNLNLNWYGSGTNSLMEVTIYNAFGSALKKVTQSVPQGNSSFTINVYDLPAGIYYIKSVDAKNSLRFDSKFVKQ